MGRGPEVILEIDTDAFTHFADRPGDLRLHAKALRDCSFAGNAGFLDHIADQWEAKLPKPRMAEPVSGEKVIAYTRLIFERRIFLRWTHGDGYQWISKTGSGTARWDELIDPEPFTPEAAAALS